MSIISAFGIRWTLAARNIKSRLWCQERSVRDPNDPTFVTPTLRAQRICIGLAIAGLIIIAATSGYAFLFMR